MKENKITFVGADDWEGLYVNDKLVMENHSLDVFKVLNAIGVDYKYIEADNEWIGEQGSLPLKLKDVKEAKE